MKSRIAAANVVILTSVLGLAFCSGGDSTNSSLSSSPTGPSSDCTITIMPRDVVNPQFVRTETGVNKYAEGTGLNVFQRGPIETDTTMQAQVIQDLIARGVGVIGVAPVNPGTIEPILKEATDAGIVVATHEGTSQENMIYDIEASDNAKCGAFIMDNLTAAIGEKGTYTTMVSRVTNASHNKQIDGAVARQKEAYSNTTLLTAGSRVESQDNGETTYQVTKEVLKEYPEVTGILDTSPFDAPGIARAIGELGLQGKVSIVGTGMPDANKEILDKGLVSVLAPWDPADVGYAMASLAAKILDEEKIEDGIDLDPRGYVMYLAEDSTKVLGGDGWIRITEDNAGNFGF